MPGPIAVAEQDPAGPVIVEGIDGTAHAGAAQRGARGHEGRLTNEAGGEAGALLVGAPGLVPGNERGLAAAGPQGQREQQDDQYANARLVHGRGIVRPPCLICG